MKRKGLMLAASIILISGLLSCGGGSSGNGSGTNVVGPDGGKLKNRAKAKGVATIWNNDSALARDRALEDARNKVVEKVLGSNVFGETIVRDYEMVSMAIKSTSFGLVKDERILDEGTLGQNLYHITIEATVEKGVVEGAIQKAIERYGSPKLMVLVKESFLNKRNAPGFTLTGIVIQEKFGDLNFDFVDPGVTKRLVRQKRAVMSRAMKGQIGRDVKDLLLMDNVADIVILGEVKTVDQSASIRKWTKTMFSHRAFVKLKAIDVYTGSVLSTGQARGTGVRINKEEASSLGIEAALSTLVGKKDKAGKFQAGPFLNRIIKRFTKAATARKISITVTGLDRKGLKTFRNALQQKIRGVSAVTSRGQKGRAANIEVSFAGKTDAFLDDLDEKAENLGFNVKIKSSFPNRATIRVTQTQ